MERLVEQSFPILTKSATRINLSKDVLQKLMSEMKSFAKEYDEIRSKSSPAKKSLSSNDLLKLEDDKFIAELKATLQRIANVDKVTIIRIEFDFDWLECIKSEESIISTHTRILNCQQGTNILMLKAYWIEGKFFNVILEGILSKTVLNKREAYNFMESKYGFSESSVRRRIALFKLLEGYPILFLCSMDFSLLSNKTPLIMKRRKTDTTLDNLLNRYQDKVIIKCNDYILEDKESNQLLAFDAEFELREAEKFDKETLTADYLNETVESLCEDETIVDDKYDEDILDEIDKDLQCLEFDNKE